MSRGRPTTALALLDQRQPEPPHLVRVVSATCTRSSGNGIAASISTGIGHGVRGRLLRLIQWGASEADVLQAHEGALNDGRSLVYMPVRDETQRARVADALRSSGGRHLLHFRLWRLSSCPRSVSVTTGGEDKPTSSARFHKPWLMRRGDRIP